METTEEAGEDITIEDAIRMLEEGDEKPVEQEAPKKETKAPEPAKEEPKKKDPMSSRFAALSRKEKEIQEERKRIESERQAFESERKEYQEKLSSASKAQDLLKMAKDDPLGFIRETGVSFEKLADAMLNDDGTLKTQSELSRVKAEVQEQIEALKKEREEDKKSAQKQEEERKLREQEQYIVQQVEQYKAHTNKVIQENPETYELILANNAQDSVWSVIESYFYETGEILEPQAAAEQVEEYLLQQAQKLLTTKKLASPKGAVRDKSIGVRETKKPSKTLTNDATALSLSDEEIDSLSADEALQRAFSML